jgi:hypothetical protein
LGAHDLVRGHVLGPQAEALVTINSKKGQVSYSFRRELSCDLYRRGDLCNVHKAAYFLLAQCIYAQTYDFETRTMRLSQMQEA